MVCRVLYNYRTSVWFVICETYSKIEFCTKFSAEISVWNCREQLVLWCSRKMDDIVMFYGKMCNLGRSKF